MDLDCIVVHEPKRVVFVPTSAKFKLASDLVQIVALTFRKPETGGGGGKVKAWVTSCIQARKHFWAIRNRCGFRARNFPSSVVAQPSIDWQIPVLKAFLWVKVMPTFSTRNHVHLLR